MRALAVGATLTVVGISVPAVAAQAEVATSFKRIGGFKSPGTPVRYDKVGILKFGSKKARNILVLNPGTSAGAAYFAPLAKSIVAKDSKWQVWSVERRENLLEDQSVLTQAKFGKASTQRLFDYYLGYLTDKSVTNHFKSIPDSSVGYAKQWGLRTEIEDLHRVVSAAKRKGGKVVLGGHSLGGTITTAYATWDFKGKPGARGLSGLVYIDGGSGRKPVTSRGAKIALKTLKAGSPWLAFGGIPAPFAGLFSSGGSTLALIAPNAPSIAQGFAALPANLKPPVPVTNLGLYGYAQDNDTSPASLAAAQGHIGRLAASGSPRGWNQAGEISPIQRFATMFSGTGLRNLDGTAWYHPRRLTIDAGAVANGNPNAAQKILGVRSTHGHDLPKGMRIYAFGAALGGKGVLDAATALARQSGISRRRLTLINRKSTYSHNDPNSASPSRNAFLKGLTPYLKRVAR